MEPLSVSTLSVIFVASTKLVFWFLCNFIHTFRKRVVVLTSSSHILCPFSCDEDDVDHLLVDLGAGEQNVYCGSRRPPTMMSTASRLQLTLRTGNDEYR